MARKAPEYISSMPENEEHYDESNGLSNMYIWSVSEDSHGQLWAGSWGGGLYEKEGEHFANAAATSNLMIPIITALVSEQIRRLVGRNEA